ncbi:MAG: NADH:ubiquinone reductase (Na(+)-transporting) subunit B, partial [Capnocytophaga ochracea]
MSLKSKLNTLKEKYKGTKMEKTFNALHTFLYTPNEVSHGGTHIKAADDLKRTMNMVVLA